MENRSSPTPAEAAAALADAEGSRARLVHDLVLPSWFHVSISAAIAVQIATTALGLASDHTWAHLLLVIGLVGFALAAGVQLVRFRRLNGVWLGGLASRVVFGTATAASATYAAAFAASVWAACAGAWWLVPLCAAAGGVAYGLSGRRWVRIYRDDPAAHGRGESIAWLATLIVFAIAALVLLVVER